jgi:hypothetical protein
VAGTWMKCGNRLIGSGESRLLYRNRFGGTCWSERKNNEMSADRQLRNNRELQRDFPSISVPRETHKVQQALRRVPRGTFRSGNLEPHVKL